MKLINKSHTNFTFSPYLYSFGVRRMKMFTTWVACLVVSLTAMAGEHVLEFKGKDGLQNDTPVNEKEKKEIERTLFNIKESLSLTLTL